MRETTDGTATYGVSRVVAEPAAGSLEVVEAASVKLGSGQTGGIGTSDRRTFESFLQSRDWQITLPARRTVPGAEIFRRAPRVEAIIEYGTGATSAELVADVPIVGLTLHVAAQWVSVKTRVRAPLLGTAGEVLTECSVVPGRPTNTTYTQRVVHEGDVVDVRVPPFAVGVAVFSTAVDAGPPVVTTYALGSGTWFFADVTGAPVGVLGPLPLTSQAALVTTLRAPSQGVAIPSSANVLRLAAPAAFPGEHWLQWELQS